MIVIHKPRGDGKTTELIKIASEQFLYIVCMSQGECSRIAMCAAELGLDIPFPMSFSEFIKGQYHGAGIKGFVIDNAEQLIARMANGVPVMAISINKDDKDEKNKEV